MQALVFLIDAVISFFCPIPAPLHDAGNAGFRFQVSSAICGFT